MLVSNSGKSDNIGTYFSYKIFCLFFIIFYNKNIIVLNWYYLGLDILNP